VFGYNHSGYAKSLQEFGDPRLLPHSGGWILERQVPGFPARDAMGCYPIFTCQNWRELHIDLEDIRCELVSLALVTDPFGNYDENYLQQCFKDVMIPFKRHYITDLSYPVEKIVSKHHRYYARQALKSVKIEYYCETEQFLDEWCDLYAFLIERQGLKGIKAFSRTAFSRQLCVPGIIMMRALYQDVTVGAHLWYIQGDVAYSHLAASSSVGYRMSVSYALYWGALNYFADKVKWLDIGAGAGVTGKGKDGLSQFKSGWSTGTRQVYFCGRIFDHGKYFQILKEKGIPANDYFPSYRMGEFG
jgi:hypothetical protein